MIRIVAGRSRGVLLSVLRGRDIRPTSGRVREAVFSMIGRAVEDAEVLDLFAGSGALGIESLSRGARRAVFVDDDRRAVAVIRENLRRAGLEEAADVRCAAHRVVLPRLAREGRRFDLVFLDPPYRTPWLDEALERLARGPFLKPDAIVIAEHPSEATPPVVGELRLLDRRRYGSIGVSIFGSRAGEASAAPDPGEKEIP